MKITYESWKKAIKTIFTFELWSKIILIQGVFIFAQLIVSFFTVPSFFKITPDSINPNTINTFFSLESFPFKEMIVFLIGIFFIIELTFLMIAALHITNKKFFEGEKINPFQVISEDSISVFIPFHFYILRVLWYVIMPMVVIFVGMGFIGFILSQVTSVSFQIFIPITLIVAGVMIFYRSFRAVFCIPFYFEYQREKTRKEIFDQAIEFSRGNVLNIFLSALGLALMIGVLAGIIAGIIIFTLGIETILSMEVLYGFSPASLLPQLLFGGMQVVFFYTLYKIFLFESQPEKDNDISFKIKES